MLTVKCPACGHTQTLKFSEVEDPKIGGRYCDGRYGSRHPVVLMLGPSGKAKA
jgi:hypothetical protein